MSSKIGLGSSIFWRSTSNFPSNGTLTSPGPSNKQPEARKNKNLAAGAQKESDNVSHPPRVIVFSHRQVKPHDSAHPQSIHIHPSIAARRFFCTTTPRTAPRSSKFSVFLSLARVCLDPAVCCLYIPDPPLDGLFKKLPSHAVAARSPNSPSCYSPVDPPRDGSESTIDVQHSIAGHNG
ncbi:hypothetical protein FOXYSP1_01092 [Fusarium oxysporum f. sp. phaseoli]